MATKQPAAENAAIKKTRNLTIVGTVKSESATAVHLFIDGVELDLVKDGDTWSGKKALDAGDSIDVKFTVKGFDGTAWAVEVDVDCAEGPAKLKSKSGTIGSPGGSGFEKTVVVPANPCANNQG